jgi:hypothetical protein
MILRGIGTIFQLGISKVVADGVTLTKYVAHALRLSEDYVKDIMTSTEDLQRYSREEGEDALG